MKNRKVLAAIMFTCLFLFACSRETEGDRSEEVSSGKEEIVLWSYYETREQQQALDELMEGFNKSQDTYNLTWEYHGPVTEFNKRIAIGITQNQLPDLVVIDNPDMRKYVDQGAFEDITEYVEEIDGMDSYYTNVLESVVYDGSYYGFPFCCNNTGLFYNVEVFEQEGIEVPATWEAFLETAILLTTEERYGFAMSGIDGEQSAFQILPWILSAGDSIENLGGTGTLEAFELISDLVESGAMSRNCINWSQNDVAKKFIAGECAMMENGPWVIPALHEAGSSYGIVNLPVRYTAANVTGGENLGILKDKNVEGAMAFIRYYHEDANMLNANLRSNSLPPKKQLARQMLSVKTEYQVFVEQMDACISRASYEEWGRVSALLSDAQLKILTGESTPQEVAETFQER